MEAFKRLVGALEEAGDVKQASGHTLKNLNRLLFESKVELAGLTAALIQVRRMVRRQEKALAEWGTRAEEAVRRDNDRLARIAIERRLAHENNLSEMRPRLKKLTDHSDIFKECMARLISVIDSVSDREMVFRMKFDITPNIEKPLIATPDAPEIEEALAEIKQRLGMA